MLNVRWIRDNPEEFRRAMALRGVDQVSVADMIRLDRDYRDILQRVENVRSERNALSKEIGSLTRQPAPEEESARRGELVAKAGLLGKELDALQSQLKQTEGDMRKQLLELPNLPDQRVPVGDTEKDDVVVREEGVKRSFDFQPRHHWELGEGLGIIDFERGTKISGSRFYVLEGLGARLQRALITFMLDLHTRTHSYREVYLPAMVKEESMWSGGWLPKFADNMYHDAEEDYWFVPTSEVALTNLHRDEILEPDTLPLRYVAYSPCFRREKMSAGRDVRGLTRGHQFDKVELYKYTKPEEAGGELSSMLDDAEEVLRRLELPYRVKLLCSGELGFNATVSFDLEAWSPGAEEWLEVSSVSSCGDFQARRAGIRFRREKGGKPELAHTLNGSGLAIPRTMIALLETYQREDGAVAVPEALQEYMDGLKEIRPADGH